MTNQYTTSVPKTALITGGSRGIGRNTVVSLAKRGVHTIFTYHSHSADADAVVAAVRDAGAQAIALQLDTSAVASFDAFVESVKDALANLGATRFDFLVNNAGNNHRNMPFEKATEEEFDSVCNVHFRGVFFLTQKLLPLINDGGRIINISTARTRTASPGGAVYASMKGAVEVLSRHLAKELGLRRIAVNVVAPGPSKSPALMRRSGQLRHPELRVNFFGPRMKMGVRPQREMSPEISIRVSEAGRRYEAVLRISEALSACREPEDLTRILSEQLGEFLDFFQFYIIVYKENSTEVEWAVVGSEKSLMSAYADVPVQERPSWRAYATQEPFQIADWDADERVPARLKQGIAAQGLRIGPLVFVPLTTPHGRLGALGMSGRPETVYSSEDIGFLRLIGRVVAFAIDDNFNLRRAEAARAELLCQNEKLQRSERELREVIETIPSMAWSAAADGAGEFFNQRWLDYAGLTADQAQGGGWV